MKALILNGEEVDGLSLKHISKSIKEELRSCDFEVEEILLKEKEIADCLGLFKCWVKTPGICIIDDYGRKTAAKLINSELVVFLTPVTFGSYSYQLKKALDRMIPLISPYFKKIEGEFHHRKRYSKYPSILAVGVMEKINQAQSKIFKELVKRNSINFHSAYCETEVFEVADDFNNKKIKNLVKVISEKVGEQND
ncbi:NADPH-dependent FMN reductase [Halanaerobium saccharolyticum]|uniref:NADPH-dependent FMN reductase n=1 Tax=Halanaerobium saccharolyticum TaxID=43595 RepID=A0A4R7YPT7_9FIRM|nr:NAD(P)H-dependent oxidoreductase [Halanaerobium saccharolyticum]RAK05265.1 NADPH-dependent FMN reductase [Halanaerobium saccharolyticum]TDV99630.1 NADPH-dependent FMN reductase [Halanaerobium saccharolyticum]TDX51746.1 NADPH-dependent FMN reductase [Halanaerobium saccharolyticum]